MKPLKLRTSYDVAFAADGDRLMTVGRDVWLWSITARKQQWRGHPFSHPSNSAFSPDGEFVVVKNTAGQLVALSTADGSVRWSTTEEGEGSPVAFSPSGVVLVDGSWAGRLTFRSPETGEPITTTEHVGMIDEVHVLDGDAGFITAHQGHRLPAPHFLRWSWDLGAEPIEQFERPGRSAAFDRTGDRFALTTIQEDRTFLVTVHDRQRTTALFVAERPRDRSPSAMCWSPDGTLLAIAQGGAVHLVDGRSGGSIRSWDIPYACAVAFSPDSSLLAMGSWEAGLVVDLRVELG